MRREFQIGVRVTAEELAKLDSLAHATERDRSKVVRVLLNQALAREAPDLVLASSQGAKGLCHA